jgi:predicted PurR-regulated permease PerM
MPKTIEISHRTILFTLAILAGGWVILQVRDILYLLFIAFILMTALRPVVESLAVYKIPRPLTVIVLYGLILSFFGYLIASIAPSLANQLNRLLQELPSYAERILPTLNINVQELTTQVAPITQNILQVGVGIFNNVVNLVTILVFTLYMILARNNLKELLKTLMRDDQAEKAHEILVDVETKLGAWARGQLTLMLIIGVFVYIGLTILGIEYALPLAVFAGLLEFIPMVGPFVGAVPAVLIALTDSPVLALSVAALYFVIQQFENHLIVPFIMRKSVGLSPIITIVAFMIGARFEGVIGAVLAIPAILVIQVVIIHLLKIRQASVE